MWGVGFAIVNARAKKLLKRLVATPMKKSHYLLALVLSRMATLSIEVIVIIGFAWIFFDVAVHGTLWSLAALAIIGALAFGGLGVLVACRVRTIEAVSGLMNLVMLPMWVLSGVFFASTNFPEAIQPFIHVLPLTALNDSLRIIVNEGRPFEAVLPQVGILSAWGGISFVLSLKLFRWQ
jgi:ABC-2 type transport system permease protein